MKISFALVLVLLFSNMTSPVKAQNTDLPKSSNQSRKLVNVPVIVSDREGRRIPNLKKENFMLYQGGVRQNITTFATEEEPISVALLIDTSGSTQVVLNKIKNAAKDFVDQLNPNDQCLIATFDSKLNILIAFNSDRDALKKSLDKIQTAEKEGTVLLSAIDQIAQISFKRVEGRKAIVILSDGKDNGSTISRRDLLSTLEESDVSIYPIYYQSGMGFNKPVINSTGAVVESKEITKPKKEKKPKPRKNVYTITIPVAGDTYNAEEVKLIDKVTTTEAVVSLRDLSDITAGRFYLSDDAKLSAVFKQVAAELRQQYLIGFYSEGSSSDVIQDVNVKVDHPNSVVQTRKKIRP
jgi:VWFA-related protein